MVSRRTAQYFWTSAGAPKQTISEIAYDKRPKPLPQMVRVQDFTQAGTV
jgi:hypothetical protein